MITPLVSSKCAYTCVFVPTIKPPDTIVYITEITLTSSIIIYICYSDHVLFFMEHAENALFSLYVGTARILPIYC